MRAESNRLVMKRLARTRKYIVVLIAVVCGVIILSCASHLHKAGDTDKVTIEENCIFIPGTQISQTDQKAMNDILKHFHKYLYRIRTYENGNLVQEQGKLSIDIIGKAKVSKVAESAKLHGLTGLTTQVGLGTHTSNAPAEESGVRTGSHTNTPTPTASPREESGVGTGSHTNTPTPTVSPREESGVATGTHVTHATDEETAESKELVRRLKPILEKYSR
jgi:hypothetical protein